MPKEAVSNFVSRINASSRESSNTKFAIVSLPIVWPSTMPHDGNNKSFDALGSTYEDVYGKNQGQLDFVQKSIDLLKSNNSSPTVLDVGVGTGRPTSVMAAEAGCQIWGNDYSEKMVEIASKNIPGGKFAHAHILDYEPPSSQPSFDGVFSVFVGHGMKEDEMRRFVAEKLSKWVKQGGYLFMGTFLLDAFPDDADWKELNREKGNGTVFRKFFGNRRTFLVWSKDGWTKLLKTGGFEIVDAVLSPFQPDADCDWEPHYFITARRS